MTVRVPAAWVKLLPLAGVGYLLLKRKWLPAMLAVACAVGLAATAPPAATR